MSEVPLQASLDGLNQRLIDTQQVWSFHEELHVTSEVAEGVNVRITWDESCLRIQVSMCGLNLRLAL